MHCQEFLAYSILSQEYPVKFQGPYRRLDDQTIEHSERVAHNAERLAYLAGYRWCALRRIKIGGLLHDIGKVFCDQEVLWYAGKISEEDKKRAGLKDHPLGSEQVVNNNKVGADIARLVREHHEFVNGGGYPFGIRRLFTASSILKISDEWDRMRNPVPWRPFALSPVEAYAELQTHFGERYPERLRPAVDKWFHKFENK